MNAKGVGLLSENLTREDFTALYEKTKTDIHKYLYKKCRNISDIEDLFQDTYIGVYKYMLGGGKIGNAEAFVKTVAKRTLSGYYSFLKKKTEYESELDDNIPTPQSSDDELADRIYDLIQKKPEKVRKIFYLRHTMQLSFAQIAGELGLSESSVKAKYYKTIELVKRKLDKEETK